MHHIYIAIIFTSVKVKLHISNKFFTYAIKKSLPFHELTIRSICQANNCCLHCFPNQTHRNWGDEGLQPYGCSPLPHQRLAKVVLLPIKNDTDKMIL